MIELYKVDDTLFDGLIHDDIDFQLLEILLRNRYNHRYLYSDNVALVKMLIQRHWTSILPNYNAILKTIHANFLRDITHNTEHSSSTLFNSTETDTDDRTTTTTETASNTGGNTQTTVDDRVITSTNSKEGGGTSEKDGSNSYDTVTGMTASSDTNTDSLTSTRTESDVDGLVNTTVGGSTNIEQTTTDTGLTNDTSTSNVQNSAMAFNNNLTPSNTDSTATTGTNAKDTTNTSEHVSSNINASTTEVDELTNTLTTGSIDELTDVTVRGTSDETKRHDGIDSESVVSTNFERGSNNDTIGIDRTVTDQTTGESSRDVTVNDDRTETHIKDSDTTHSSTTVEDYNLAFRNYLTNVKMNIYDMLIDEFAPLILIPVYEF